MDVFGDLGLALDRVEQQHEFIAADPRQDVGVAQIHCEPLGHLDQQRITDGVAVIIVDVLEIIDVEKCEREMVRNAVARQKRIDAMFDHPPCRQAGQLVIIGRTEQRILERLLLGDVGGTGEQQIAVPGLDRAVGGKKHMFVRPIGNRFFENGGAAAAEQFETGFAAIGQLRGGGCGCGHLQQGRGGVVYQQEIAVLVLNRNPGWQQFEHVAQHAQFSFEGAFIAGLRRGRLKVLFVRAVHSRGAWQSPL